MWRHFFFFNFGLYALLVPIVKNLNPTLVRDKINIKYISVGQLSLYKLGFGLS